MAHSKEEQEKMKKLLESKGYSQSSIDANKYIHDSGKTVKKDGGSYIINGDRSSNWTESKDHGKL